LLFARCPILSVDLLPGHLKFQDLINHSLCLTDITATKQHIMIKDVIEIVNGPAFFMPRGQGPFGFVAFIEIRTKATTTKDQKEGSYKQSKEKVRGSFSV
jgi:hypothetical protein